MIELIWDEGFKKSYKKRIKENLHLKNKFWECLNLFIKDPFHQKLKTHKLSGILKNYYAFSIDYDCRVIFQFSKKQKEALLIDIGTHDEVY